ncbi:hypothetical protein EYV94_01385 [Puteibacter caeruleilacunae]|nr:hypothetical protein EYV94_01385 [Puteibacter caeruleilacunae]
MKHITSVSVIIILVNLLSFTQTKAQQQDTTFLNTTHVMTVMGEIISNSVTSRMTYKLDGSTVMEEKVVTNMSYPMENGETHKDISTEEFTIIDGEMNYFKGEYNTNDSVTVVTAEKDGENLLVSGKLPGESSFQVWDQKKLKEIDAYIVFFNIDELNLSKKMQIRKMYDLYGMELRNNKLTLQDKETIELAGQKFECSIVKFDYGLIKGKLWFAKGPADNYFLVKEEAQSQEYGPFDLDLTDYNTIKPTTNNHKKEEFGF